MKESYRVVVVGGGVNGLGAAYHLAREGVTDVLVLERRYIPYGASGRNGGGVRAQWSTRENVELARYGIERFRRLSAELEFNVWFRQGGYLFLAFDEPAVAAMRRLSAFHRTVGVKSRVVDPVETHVLVPELNPDGVLAGMYHPEDGIVFPWAVVHGLAKRLREMDVDVVTHTGVTGLRTSGGRVTHVETTRGTVAADWVVNAAGCWAAEVAAFADVRLPNRPYRHEILVTEALKPFLDPMIVDLRNGLYANQDMRGEVVAGIGDPREPSGVNFRSSYAFATRLARALTDLLPALGDARVLRQWAGMYDVTPDNKPVLGPAPGLENFLQLSGASGHGFMISPATTEMTADIILGRKPRFAVEPFLLSRFDKGVEVHADALVIG